MRVRCRRSAAADAHAVVELDAGQPRALAPLARWQRRLARSRAASVTSRPARADRVGERRRPRRRRRSRRSGRNDIGSNRACGCRSVAGRAARSDSGQRACGARRRAYRSGRARAARRPPRRSWRHCRCTAPPAARPARCRPRTRADAAPCGSPRWRRRRRRRPARSGCRSARGTACRPARSRSATTSTTACWNEAQRSRTSWSLIGAIFSASRRSAVLRPESEKSALRLAQHRPRQREAGRIAACASFSTCGPPG